MTKPTAPADATSPDPKGQAPDATPNRTEDRAAPETDRALSGAELDEVSGGMRMLNPQPLPPRAPH